MGIRQKIVKSHQPGGEGLVTFAPNQEPTTGGTSREKFGDITLPGHDYSKAQQGRIGAGRGAQAGQDQSNDGSGGAGAGGAGGAGGAPAYDPGTGGGGGGPNYTPTEGGGGGGGGGPNYTPSDGTGGPNYTPGEGGGYTPVNGTGEGAPAEPEFAQ
jgi:hypothetical protein